MEKEIIETFLENLKNWMLENKKIGDIEVKEIKKGEILLEVDGNIIEITIKGDTNKMVEQVIGQYEFEGMEFDDYE